MDFVGKFGAMPELFSLKSAYMIGGGNNWRIKG
jgi:hypothetical protein